MDLNKILPKWIDFNMNLIKWLLIKLIKNQKNKKKQKQTKRKKGVYLKITIKLILKIFLVKKMIV